MQEIDKILQHLKSSLDKEGCNLEKMTL